MIIDGTNTRTGESSWKLRLRNDTVIKLVSAAENISVGEY